MKQKLSMILSSLIVLILSLFIVFTIFNSFPLKSYIPVHEKWYLYGKVVPPKDYNDKILREIDIDLLAPKETSQHGDFYWLQTSGDLITLSNRNFQGIEGVLSFYLDADPCGTERTIFIGTQSGSLEKETNATKNNFVEIEFKIESNSSIFLSIVGSPIKPCKIKEDIDRNFLAKISELRVRNLEAIK